MAFVFRIKYLCSFLHAPPLAQGRGVDFAVFDSGGVRAME